MATKDQSTFLKEAGRCGWPTRSGGALCRNKALPGKGACAIHLEEFEQAELQSRIVKSLNLIEDWYDPHDPVTHVAPSKTLDIGNWYQEIIQSETGEDSETIAAILDATETLRLSVDLTIPLAVSQFLSERGDHAMDEFGRMLVERGIDATRLLTRTYMGMWRFLPKGNYQHDAEFIHSAMIVDNTVLVDPFTAVLYPASKVDVPIDIQAENTYWLNPLAETPMIEDEAFYGPPNFQNGVRWIAFDRVI